MQTQTNSGMQKRSGAVAGKQVGQEAVIELESLETKVEHLVALRVAAADAANDYKEAVKIVAEAAGLHAATVNKFITAKASENFEERKGKVLQLALVFEIL